MGILVNTPLSLATPFSPPTFFTRHPTQLRDGKLIYPFPPCLFREQRLFPAVPFAYPLPFRSRGDPGILSASK